MSARASQVSSRVDRVLLAILAAAFLSRLAVVLWLSDTVPYSDAAYYHAAAQRMAEDWRFPFDRHRIENFGKLGWWPPLYPAFASGLYRIFGPSHRVVAGAQVVLGTLLVWLVYRIGRRAAGRGVARSAATLVALDPTYVFLTNILASENLFVMLLALGLGWSGGIWNASGRTARRRTIGSGLAFGLGALTRAVGVLVPVVVALAAWPRAADRRRWLATSVLLAGTCALTIAPWTLRNTLVIGSPALVCFGGGVNFYFGHNPDGVGYRDLAQTPMARLTTQREIDVLGYRLGLDHLAAHPVGFFTRGVHKIGALFELSGYAPHVNSTILLPDGWQTDAEKGRQAAELRARQRAKNRYLDGIFTSMAKLHTVILLAGAALALVRWRALPPDLRVAAWLCLYWIGAHVVFWAQARFRYPMEMLLALLAAWGLDGIGRLATRLRGSRSAAPPVRAGGRKAGVHAIGLTLGLFVGTTLGLAVLPGCQPPPPERFTLDEDSQGQPPYDDPIEVAAANALGPRPEEYAVSGMEPIRLGDFLLLDGAARRARENAARSLVAQADTWARTSRGDSLPPYLEALRLDPSCMPAYEQATRIVLDRNEVSRAHALAAQALRLDAHNARLWALLGEAYRREGDGRRAARALEYAIALEPRKIPSAYATLATLYVQSGQLARADSLAAHAPPGVSPSLHDYVDAMQAQAAGDVEGARAAFAAAARDSTVPVALLVAWGNAEYEAGRLDAAREAYSRAVQRDPGEPAALLGLGVVQRASGDPAGAAVSFAHVASVRPHDPVAHFNLAGASLEAAQKAGRGRRADSLYADADAAFARCIDLGYRSAESRLRRAEVQLLRGRPAEAYSSARALVNDPQQGGAAALLAGQAAIAARRPQDTVTVLAPLYQVDSLGTDGIALLGNAYLQLELPQYAAPILQRAHERDPQDWKTTINLAVALSQSGDLAAAEALLRPLATSRPDDPFVLRNLAAVLQRRGQREEAARLLERLDRLDR